MRLSLSTVCAILVVSVVRGAPALDTATLLDNAKKAQSLNAGFVTLKTTDPCQGEAVACVGGDLATCVNGKWDTSQGKCQQSQQCFAVPDVRTAGTALVCTSESNVLALMQAAGVSGGVTGSNSNSTSTSTLSSSTSTTSSGQSNPTTVTVTVFPSAVATTTTTVSLSQFSGSSQTSSSTSTSSTSTSSSTVSVSSGSASSPTPAVIRLSDGSSPTTITPTPSSSVIPSSSVTPPPSPNAPSNVILLTAGQPSNTPSAAAASAPTTVTAPVGPDSPGGGYGY